MAGRRRLRSTRPRVRVDPGARRALEAAHELAGVSGAPLKQALKDAVEEQVRAQFEEALDAAPDDLSVEAKLVSGNAAKALADAAKAPGSILLVGSRSYGPLHRVLVGPVSRALGSFAPAPLIGAPAWVHDESKTAPTTKAGTAA